MMDSDWGRRIHLHWVYVSESGQWLARRPGSVFNLWRQFWPNTTNPYSGIS